MKKFIIALIAVVLGLSSCSKESQLLGSWKLQKIEASGISIDASYLDIDMTVTFTKDLVNIVTKEDGKSYTETAAYSVSGNTIIIEDMSATFEIDGKTLILTADIELDGDVTGAAKIHFTKL